MHTLITAGCLLVSSLFFDGNTPTNNDTNSSVIYQAPARPISILYPKQGQKVRGEIKIYGKAKPNAQVQVYVTSTYFKKAYTNEKIIKDEGPLKRMNRVFNLTADKRGLWTLKPIDLTNAGWEENFTIRAVSENKATSINVYDHTKPLNID